MIKKLRYIVGVLFLAVMLIGCTTDDKTDILISTAEQTVTEGHATAGDATGDTIYDTTHEEEQAEAPGTLTDTTDIPDFSGELSVEVNGNIPNLNKSDADNGTFIHLSELDNLGRCGVAYMCAGPETLPEGERGEIGHIRPSGWHTVKYPEIVDGMYVYNRSHLLMWAFSGLNDDERNLITGTRQLNADEDAGMLYYETKVLNYIKETGNHVLYRSTPVYKNTDDLLAYGVELEALSVEDDAVSFHVFVYNVQNGIGVDYKTGDTWEDTSVVVNTEKTEEITEETQDDIQEPVQEDITPEEEPAPEAPAGETYILNTNTKKIHKPSCSSVSDMKDKNKREYTGDIETIVNEGYERCKRCF